MPKKYAFTVLVFILWIFGFYFATGGFTGDDLVNILLIVEPWSLLVGVGTYLIAVGTGIWVLHRSLRYVGIQAPWIGVGRAWIFGSFIDNIAPTVTPVGEASMAYFLEKFYRISYTKGLAAVGMYVSAWGVSVSLFSISAVLLANHFVGIPAEFLIPVLLIVVVFSTITCGWILLLNRRNLVRRIVGKFIKVYNKLYNYIRRKKVTFDASVYEIEFDKSYNSLKILLTNKRQVVGSVALFLIPQIMHVICLYSLLLGFGAEISIFEVLTIQIVASVAGLISFIPSGLGIYEGASIGGFALSGGVAESSAFGAVFLYRLIFVWGTNLIGGVIGMHAGIKNPGSVAGK